MIQNEDEERNLDEKLKEDTSATAGEESNRDVGVVISAKQKKPSLGAVPKRTSPRNKQKPSTDRLPSKPTTKPGQSKQNTIPVREDSSREGQEACDFIRHLVGYDPPLEVIFSYLSGRDLCRVVQVRSLLSFVNGNFLPLQVSTTWRSALKNAKEPHNDRRLAYISNMKRERENLDKENFFDRRISPRRAMASITNRTSPSTKRDRNHSASILVSPSKVRHMLFREEGKKLSEGERLVKCPACSSPSRVSTLPVSPNSRPAVNRQTEKATCSSSQCSFVFCPECQCADHPDRPCSTRRKAYKLSKSGGVTSQKSKNRLRRL